MKLEWSVGGDNIIAGMKDHPGNGEGASRASEPISKARQLHTYRQGVTGDSLADEDISPCCLAWPARVSPSRHRRQSFSLWPLTN